MKIVLDTNVIVSALFWKGNEAVVLGKCKSKELEMTISPEILDEVDEVLERKFKYPDDKRVDFLRNILLISKLVFPDHEIDLITDDPKDNMILECAISGNAEYIVSGDKHLLNIKKYKNITILNAKDMLKILKTK